MNHSATLAPARDPLFVKKHRSRLLRGVWARGVVAWGLLAGGLAAPAWSQQSVIATSSGGSGGAGSFSTGLAWPVSGQPAMAFELGVFTAGFDHCVGHGRLGIKVDPPLWAGGDNNTRPPPAQDFFMEIPSFRGNRAPGRGEDGQIHRQSSAPSDFKRLISTQPGDSPAFAVFLADKMVRLRQDLAAVPLQRGAIERISREQGPRANGGALGSEGFHGKAAR